MLTKAQPECDLSLKANKLIGLVLIYTSSSKLSKNFSQTHGHAKKRPPKLGYSEFSLLCARGVRFINQPEGSSEETAIRKVREKGKGGKLLKKLWCCVGGEYYNII